MPQLIAIVGGGERGEIVFAFEQPRELDHSIFIQRISVVINVAPLERGANLRANNPILIRFRDRLEARMKIIIRERRIDHTNIAGQQPVHRAPQILDRNRIPERKRRDLRQRVHSGIGAPDPSTCTGAFSISSSTRSSSP